MCPGETPQPQVLPRSKPSPRLLGARPALAGSRAGRHALSLLCLLPSGSQGPPSEPGQWEKLVGGRRPAGGRDCRLDELGWRRPQTPQCTCGVLGPRDGTRGGGLDDASKCGDIRGKTGVCQPPDPTARRGRRRAGVLEGRGPGGRVEEGRGRPGQSEEDEGHTDVTLGGGAAQLKGRGPGPTGMGRGAARGL